MRAANKGFTLLELLVVLGIGAIMIAVIPPLMSGAGLTTELRGSARQMAAGLRFARNHAVTRQQTAVLTVDTEARHFTVTGNARKINLPSSDKVEVKLYTAQSELIDDTSGNVRFFPDGSSTGGYIALADDKVEYRVNVDWLTGQVAIEDRDVE